MPALRKLTRISILINIVRKCFNWPFSYSKALKIKHSIPIFWLIRLLLFADKKYIIAEKTQVNNIYSDSCMLLFLSVYFSHFFFSWEIKSLKEKKSLTYQWGKKTISVCLFAVRVQCTDYVSLSKTQNLKFPDVCPTLQIKQEWQNLKQNTVKTRQKKKHQLYMHELNRCATNNSFFLL